MVPEGDIVITVPLLALAVLPQIAQVDLVVEAEIGSPDGDPEVVFESVSDLGTAPNGALYVLDQRGDRVHIFTPAGGHVSTFGRRGRNPGELNRPIHIDVGGEVVSILNPSSQLNRYSPTGELIGSDRMPFGAQSVGRIADGRYAVLSEGTIARDDPLPIASLLLVGPDGADTVADTLMVAPSGNLFYRGPSATSSMGTSLCKLVHFVVTDDALWIASGMDGTLNEWQLTGDAPMPTRTVGVAIAGGLMPDSLRTRVVGQLPSQIDPESDDLYVPSVLSSICGLERSTESMLWVRLSDVDGRERWRAFDTETLDPIAELTAPEGVALRAFSAERAYGTRLDETGFVHVLVYRLGS